MSKEQHQQCWKFFDSVVSCYISPVTPPPPNPKPPNKTLVQETCSLTLQPRFDLYTAKPVHWPSNPGLTPKSVHWPSSNPGLTHKLLRLFTDPPSQPVAVGHVDNGVQLHLQILSADVGIQLLQHHRHHVKAALPVLSIVHLDLLWVGAGHCAKQQSASTHTHKHHSMPSQWMTSAHGNDWEKWGSVSASTQTHHSVCDINPGQLLTKRTSLHVVTTALCQQRDMFSDYSLSSARQLKGRSENYSLFSARHFKGQKRGWLAFLCQTAQRTKGSSLFSARLVVQTVHDGTQGVHNIRIVSKVASLLLILKLL